MNKRKQYRRKLDYNNTYNRENYHAFSIRLNNKKEAEIIQWLSQKDSLKKYLLELISKDMKNL